MGFGGSTLLLILAIAGAVMRCEAREFLVGGKDGWVRQPSEGYDHWAERSRFRVNDTLYFKYNRGNDSVLVVSRNDYYACSAVNPIHSFTDGNSTFKLDRSGPFFIISGITDSCNAGQRVIVVVLAVRPKTPPPTAPAPTVTPTPPAIPAPSSPVPAPPSSGTSKLGSGLVGVVVMTLGYIIGGFI